MDYIGLVGLIYMLTCDDPNLIYIGSSIKTLIERLKRHNKDYRRWKNTGKGYYTGFELFKAGNVKIHLLIDNLPGDKHILEEIESLIIMSEKCVNKQIPNNSKEIVTMYNYLKS